MIWKGLGVLGGTAVMIVLGVVGLARLTVPDEPTFSEELEQASVTGEGANELSPTAPGGRIEITGAREVTVSLEGDFDNSMTQIDFESDPLSIGQMYHDGLTFFPDPDACEFTQGEHNEEAGLVVVEMSCETLEDIRGNGTITLEGVLALPAGLVLALDVPETGGTIMVGDEEWQVRPETALLVGPVFPGSEPGVILSAADVGQSLFLSYDAESDSLSPGWITSDGDTTSDLPSSECSLADEELMVINPHAHIRELTIDCDSIEVIGMGLVPIEGRVVYEKIFVEDDH